jgi:hypothetical protein
VLEGDIFPKDSMRVRRQINLLDSRVNTHLCNPLGVMEQCIIHDLVRLWLWPSAVTSKKLFDEVLEH